MQLHERIRGWIHHVGLSQADIARELGISQQAVSHWMRGKGDPSIRSLLALALTLGVTMAQFWGDVPAKKRRAK